jgi:hypothetical protein
LLATFSTDGIVYVSGFKVVVLLVGKTVNKTSTASYSASLEAGLHVVPNVTTNLGVPTSFFGQPASGRSCILGLQQLDLYHYANSSFSLPTYFLLTYNGSQISGVSYNYLYLVSLTITCFGLCPASTYYSGSVC